MYSQESIKKEMGKIDYGKILKSKFPSLVNSITKEVNDSANNEYIDDEDPDYYEIDHEKSKPGTKYFNKKVGAYIYSLLNHWTGNSADSLASDLWKYKNFLFYLKKINPKLFKPKADKAVYRGTDISTKKLHTFVRKSDSKDWKYLSGYYIYIKKPFTYTPHRKVQSWTTSYKKASDFNDRTIAIGKFKDDEFLMNPEVMNTIYNGNEYEILRFGDKQKIFLAIQEDEYKDIIDTRKGSYDPGYKKLHKFVSTNIKEEIDVFEDSKTGLMRGTDEKEFNISLRKTGSKVREDINYGGCGAFAKLIYYALKKKFNIEPIILGLGVGTKPTPDKVETSKVLYGSSWNSFMDHVVVQIPGTNKCIDSDGIHTLDWLLDEYNMKWAMPVSIQTLNKWVANSAGWNHSFRRISIPNIAHYIDTLMDKIEPIAKK